MTERADLPELDAHEQRVLGSLLEKRATVPASYPLTLNALRTACNQTSSRDPIVDYDERTVEQTARALKAKGLMRIVWADTGRRTVKYHQILDEVLQLDSAGRALITVLLLRGAQAPGELRTRTERLHAFTDRDEVEQTLRALADRGLVRERARDRGDRDSRWVHLLGALADPETAAPSVPAVDRESVLAAGAAARDQRVQASYDAVAATYADRLADELTDGQPFETWLLDRVARHVDGGPVIEVGCGPGHVTAYLADAGADAVGMDLSPAMVAEARRRYPDGSYQVGDLRRLLRPTVAPAWAAVLGWYSLIHLAPSELPEAVAALARPLAPGGWLVLALHAGSEVRHQDSWFGNAVDVDVVLHEPEEIVAVLQTAGLVDVEWYLRSPLPHRAETTRRLYVIGRTPATQFTA